MGPNDNSGGDNGTDRAKFGGEHHPTSLGHRGPNLAVVVAVLVAAFCFIFFIKNGGETNIKFVFFNKTTTMRWAILMAIVLGIVIDRLLSIWWHHRRRKSREERD